MREDLKGKVQGLGAKGVGGGQGGSLILEAIIVLGMIATFTPMLYKHVADRRADIENINRANTLLYLQHKAEDYLKDPDNVTALVNELGHNQHKEIFPSEMGAGSNFDGRYIVGIRREDENNKPVLKAMIIDTVHTGSDLRAAKVAELIGLSAGIYTAIDPDAAWGINGFWSEPLSRYFDTTNIPTGAVAITTEYNKAKYRMNISDILVDADLDMGEFEVTAEQINAVRIAAENGTLDQLIAQDVRASNKVVAGKKLCVGGEEAKDCIESWEDLNVDRKADLRIVQECDAGMTDSCAEAYTKELNRTCSEVDAVYDRAGVPYPSPKIYTLTYGSGTEYTDVILTKCEGTSFIVENISTATLTNPVEQVGDYAFGITTPGWYQITLMGEVAYQVSTGRYYGAGGILIANTYYDADTLITLKGIQGNIIVGNCFGGAGMALWDGIDTTSVPTLVAGGGACVGGGGYVGGGAVRAGSSYSAWYGYGWDGTAGNNTTYCSSVDCNIGATGGRCRNSSSSGYYSYGGTGTGSSGYPCPSGYTCTTITGGNDAYVEATNYPAATYGNFATNTLTGGKGYASIIYCGTSENDCPVACGTDSDCPSDIPYCSDGACTDTKACTASSQCTVASLPYCVENLCSDTCTADSQCPTATPYCNSGICEATCIADSQCPSNKPYCNSGTCGANKACTANSDCTSVSNKPYCVSGYCSNVLYSASFTHGSYSSVTDVATVTVTAGKYQFNLIGGMVTVYKGDLDSLVVQNSPIGTLTATKTFSRSTSLKIRIIPGGRGNENGKGFDGIGLLEGSTIKLVAGGSGSRCNDTPSGWVRGCGGGGYVGGRGADWRGYTYNPQGYSWDGSKGNNTGSTGIGGGWTLPADSSGKNLGWGGTGYCAEDYPCSQGSSVKTGHGASITITYKGAN